MACLIFTGGSGLSDLRRSGKLLIFRLTPRLLRRCVRGGKRFELRSAYTPDAARAVSGIPQLIPEEGSPPGSDIAYSAFDASAAVRLRSPLSTVPARILSWLFRNVHHHRF